MKAMRDACNNATGFSPPGMFNDPALEWTKTAYMSPQ
eukprot:gene12306-10589_t